MWSAEGLCALLVWALCDACVAHRMAREGSEARDTRLAMSIVEIHGEAIRDLLSNDAYRRLNVKAVRSPKGMPPLKVTRAMD